MNKLSCITNKPMGINESTGLTVYNSYTANSGFNYMMGVREMEDLLIVENISEGTAITFLCGIQIFRKSTKELILDIPMECNTRYSRQTVMDIVHKMLFDLIAESLNKRHKRIDLDSLNNKIEELLDDCYFEKSRNAIIDWAQHVGIIKS
ncbi:hypothetical protein LJC72_02540 [Bacteroides sp. OttesenSCG-928-D19]|nr:hypothetical protein [Bacteroides sp. OttesenSCG-928-D19]